MRNRAAESGRSPPGTDFGPDAFSYDQKHLEKFTIPNELSIRLPTEMEDPVMIWRCAGAALCTAMDRLEVTYDMSVYRGYPEKTHLHLSRTSSNQASSAVGSDNTDSAISPTMLPDTMMSGLGRNVSPMARLPSGQQEIDTPPFTPVDSGASPTPSNPIGTKATPPDLQRINNRLSSSPPPEYLNRRKDSLTPLGSPCFDENAWERYLKEYDAVLQDVKMVCFPRFKGAADRIHQMQTELAQDKVHTEVMVEFALWWNSMKKLIGAYETKVKDLPVPTKAIMQRERADKGYFI